MIEFKKKNGSSINDCSKHFNFDRRTITKWLKNSSRIEETRFKRKRFCVKPSVDMSLYPALETQLYNWFIEKRSKGCCVSGLTLQLKALELFKTIYENTNEANTEFKTSQGWLVNFCNCKNLALRRTTSSGRDLPKNTVRIVKEFFDIQRSIFR